MKRKVIKQGPATLMISLPSKWAKNIGLKQGDEVELIEKGNGLLISSGSVSEGKECLIELKNIKQWIKIILNQFGGLLKIFMKKI